MAQRTPHRLVCVDVDGTVSDRFRAPIPSAGSALDAVRRHSTLRFVTNTTSISHRVLAGMLAEQGLLTDAEELVTPARSAKRVLRGRGHGSGLLIVDDGAREDFEWFVEDPRGPAVLLATEAHGRTVEEFQPAFRRLLDGATLYTLQRNRYFRKEQQLVTDLGPLAAFLSYASGREAQTLGKPSELLFRGLAQQEGCSLSEIVMVGDDAEFDASGSVRLGMDGILVRTGKYRPGDESRCDPPPTATLDSIADLPDWLGL